MICWQQVCRFPAIAGKANPGRYRNRSRATEEQRYMKKLANKGKQMHIITKITQCISEANGKAAIQWRCLLESRWFPRKAFQQAPQCSCTTPDVFRLKAALGHQHTHTHKNKTHVNAMQSHLNFCRSMVKCHGQFTATRSEF